MHLDDRDAGPRPDPGVDLQHLLAQGVRLGADAGATVRGGEVGRPALGIAVRLHRGAGGGGEDRRRLADQDPTGLGVGEAAAAVGQADRDVDGDDRDVAGLPHQGHQLGDGRCDENARAQVGVEDDTDPPAGARVHAEHRVVGGQHRHRLGLVGRCDEACLALATQRGADARQHHLGHGRERVERPPAHVGRLVVADAGLALEPGAGEGEVEVGRAVAVAVPDLGVGAGGGEAVHPHADAGLLQRLADGSHCGLLAGVDNPGDGRPGTVVGPFDQEDVAVAAGDHGRDAGQPERVVADHPAYLDDEVGDRAHAAITR